MSSQTEIIISTGFDTSSNSTTGLQSAHWQTHDCFDNHLFQPQCHSKAYSPPLSSASLLSAQHPLYSWKWTIYEPTPSGTGRENQDIKWFTGTNPLAAFSTLASSHSFTSLTFLDVSSSPAAYLLSFSSSSTSFTLSFLPPLFTLIPLCPPPPPSFPLHSLPLPPFTPPLLYSSGFASCSYPSPLHSHLVLYSLPFFFSSLCYSASSPYFPPTPA